LAAGYTVGRAGNWPVAGTVDGRNVGTAGLTLVVPLFSGGLQQSLVRQAVYRREGVRDQLEAGRRAVTREVQLQYRAVVAAIGEVQAARAMVDAARKALASTRVGQSVGTQNMTDLLLTIQTLLAAENALSQARHQLVLGRLRLQRAAGTLSDQDIAAVNALLQ
jgi:outer membrane protein